MGLSTCDNIKVIQNLQDQPSLPAADLKIEFDKGANLVKEYINNTLIDELDTFIATTNTSISNKQNKVEGVYDNNIGCLAGMSLNIKTELDGKQKIITSGTAAKEDANGNDGDIYLRHS